MKAESLLKKINRFNREINTYIPGLSFLKKLFLFLDFVKEYLFHGAYLIDYIQYDFYGKKRYERDKYIVYKKLMELQKICNDERYRELLDNKIEFCKKYKSFLKRDVLDCKKASIEEFKKFCKNKDVFFTKKHDGSCGIGVNKVKVDQIIDFENTFEQYKKNETLCEELLSQCKELKDFNDTSINTLRVVTILAADGEVKIMGGLLRMGRKGRIADNFHHNGIVAFLDGETGIVTTTGVDKNYDRFIKHPDSGKQIVGFNVPVWEKIEEEVKKAALLLPEIRYIGWDVAITENYDVAIIEGNYAAEPDGEQISTNTGRWPLYFKYLKDIKKLRE